MWNWKGAIGIGDTENVANRASHEVEFFINTANPRDSDVDGILKVRIPRGQFVPRMALRILLAEA